MARASWEVRDGKALWNGRRLAEWVPLAVEDLVRAADPLRVILFGSVARGDDGPDSDLDFLVVLPHVDRAEKRRTTIELRGAISAPVPVDVFVTDPEEIELDRDAVASLVYWPMREGVTVYERVA
jgi:predicted nucleotidyltransferase